LVVADPDYDLEAMVPSVPVPAKPGFWSSLRGRGENAIGTPAQSVPIVPTTARAAGRHSRDLDRDRSAYHFDRLPGTRAEGERIAARLGVSPLLDAAALESRLKTACRSPRILHLATHGFFLPDEQRDLNREGRGFGLDVGGFSGGPDGPGRLAGPMMENPMLRSGLALAGANAWLRAGNPPEEAEDGLLTAEDVAGLDLLATELVVLSACETGLGQIHIGEGVFGLRRAFVLAGAKTLVMSLWKVPDEPTRELMEDFYGRLLAGTGRAESLREAQLAMKAKYPEPFYWGAFICQGDPSPLDTVWPGMTGTGVATD
jgi:CHAT domain-containing protein